MTAVARVGRMFDLGLPLAMVAAVVVRIPAAASLSCSSWCLTRGDNSHRLLIAKRVPRGMNAPIASMVGSR